MRFSTAAAPVVATGWKALSTTFDAGASLVFAPAATNETTLLYANGTAADAITLAPQTAGGSYVLTVTGYAAASHVAVAGSDSSLGSTIYAADSTDGGGNANWAFADNRKVWRGTVSTSFAAAANWQDGSVPANGADVVVAADAANPLTIAEDGVAFGSLTVLGQGVAFSAPVTVARALVLVGGTATVNRTLTIGGTLVVLDGAAVTHAAQPATAETLSNACRIDVAGDMLVAAGASVSAVAKGYASSHGPGYGGANTGGSYGGVCGIRNDAAGIAVGTCYGSVFAPADCGSGGRQGGAAGGLVVLTVGGTLTLDGEIDASARSGYATDCRGASGGGVSIRAARLAGAGRIRANGENSSANSFAQGGGGRIAFVLTAPAADFGAFSGTILALGGFGAAQNTFGGGCGTVYLQTGAQADGTGTVRLDGTTTYPIINTDNSRALPYALAGFGFVGEDSLRRATVEVGANAGLYLYGDTTIGNLVFTGANSAAYPAGINFNGHVLRVRQPRPSRAERDTRIRFDNYYNGTYEDNIVWLTDGTKLMLR